MKPHKQTVRSPKARSPHLSTKKNASQPVTPQFNSLMRLMTHDTGKTFRFEIAAEEGSKVFIAGTFNGWNPTTYPLKYHARKRVFRITLRLPAGTHEYKFLINGAWHLDGKRTDCTPTAQGILNSVVKI